MEKRINLFRKGDASFKADKLVKKINLYALSFAAILLFLFILSFVGDIYYNYKKITLTKQKDQTAQQLTLDNTQFKINYIAFKKDQMKLFSANDVHFDQYYQLIKSLFTANSIPVFAGFKIDNKHKVTMTFDVASYDDLKTILTFIQSDIFLAHFSELKIDTASYSASSDQKTISLQVTGVIKDAITTL